LNKASLFEDESNDRALGAPADMRWASMFATSAVLLLALAGCAAPQQFMGIDLRGAHHTELGGPGYRSAQGQLSTAKFLYRLYRCDSSDGMIGSAEECGNLAALIDELDAALPNHSDAELALADLAWRAQAGDKHAQLELGIRFEEGNGVGQDLSKAKKLFRLAASDSGGPIWVYLPGVNGAAGNVMMLDDGPSEPGIKEAQLRFESLRAIDD